jgi:hypothetical protein
LCICREDIIEVKLDHARCGPVRGLY